MKKGVLSKFFEKFSPFFTDTDDKLTYMYVTLYWIQGPTSDQKDQERNSIIRMDNQNEIQRPAKQVKLVKWLQMRK